MHSFELVRTEKKSKKFTFLEPTVYSRFMVENMGNDQINEKFLNLVLFTKKLKFLYIFERDWASIP